MKETDATSGVKRVSAAKQRRIEDQKRREATNRALRAQGLPTAWEEAKAARRAARAALREEGLLPQQERYNGRIVKRGLDGSRTLVKCCDRCDAIAALDSAAKAAREHEAQERRSKARKGQSKVAAAAAQLPPKQIHPKEK